MESVSCDVIIGLGSSASFNSTSLAFASRIQFGWRRFPFEKVGVSFIH